MKALRDMNQNRLGYMSQAGQAQMGVEGQLASQQNTYNDALLKLFGGQIDQRGQDINYAVGMYGPHGGGGGQAVIGGQLRGTSPANQAGGYTPLGGGSSINPNSWVNQTFNRINGGGGSYSGPSIY
jgi:hypothetical protein